MVTYVESNLNVSKSAGLERHHNDQFSATNQSFNANSTQLITDLYIFFIFWLNHEMIFSRMNIQFSNILISI